MVYWSWLLLETEEEKDKKNREIKSLEGEVRLLTEGRGSHTLPGNAAGARNIGDVKIDER